jgi:hypothetical protein
LNQLTKDPLAHISVSMSYTADTEAASLFLSSASKIQELEVLDHKKLTLVLKYERPTVEETMNCDKLLSSISFHKNLRKIVVKGMSVSMSGLNSLSKTNFFSIDAHGLKIQGGGSGCFCQNS